MFFSVRFFWGNELCLNRFTARGQVRSLRGGFGRSAISSIASLEAFSSFRGGKSRLAGNLAADGAERSDERHPVRVKVGLVCCLAHQVPYPVMGEEEAPDFLLDQFRFPGPEDRCRPALVCFEL